MENQTESKAAWTAHKVIMEQPALVFFHLPAPSGSQVTFLTRALNGIESAGVPWDAAGV